MYLLGVFFNIYLKLLYKFIILKVNYYIIKKVKIKVLISSKIFKFSVYIMPQNIKITLKINKKKILNIITKYLLILLFIFNFEHIRIIANSNCAVIIYCEPYDID